MCTSAVRALRGGLCVVPCAQALCESASFPLGGGLGGLGSPLPSSSLSSVIDSSSKFYVDFESDVHLASNL